MSRVLSLVFCLTVFGGGLTAQQTRVLPFPAAGMEGSTQTPHFSGYGGGRAQQVIDAWAVTHGSAVLNELALRADGRTMPAVPSRTFSQLKLSLGYTSKTALTMSQTFATNRTGAQTVMFSGAFTLPPQIANIRPFNIVWKFQKPFVFVSPKGNLLVEFEVPIKPTKSNYFIDAHAVSNVGGSSWSFGKNGPFKSAESYTFACLSPHSVIPGGKLAVGASGLTRAIPAAIAFGLSNHKYGPIPLPFDLAGVGAPGNHLYVSVDFMFIPTWTQTVSGWKYDLGMSIPNAAGLKGLNLYMQTLFVDAKSNNLGWVTSAGLGVTISGNVRHTQLLGHWDYQKATGMWTPGVGMVMQFTGLLP